MKKQVKNIIDSEQVMMGNHQLGQPIPSEALHQISPFILLHHGAPHDFEAGGKGIDVPPHPHRGFEPVTFLFSGEIEHNDSRGNNSVIKSGGVQWMTAGMGIIHSEGTPSSFNEKGGTFEMIQLWINLPAKLKMVEPRYQGFQREDIPFYGENGVRVNVVAGEMGGLKGPVDSLTDVTALTIEIEKGASVELDYKVGQNVLLYLLHGKAKVNGAGISDQQLVEFENEGTEVEIRADEKSLFLIVAGDPIDEPMAQYGPYVMNTQTEIMEAMRDYQMGKMGVL